MNQKTRVAVGLGSNLGDRLGYIHQAFDRLKEDLLQDSRLSTIHETKAWGGVAGPGFLNAVAVGETDWKPPAIVSYLKEVERDLGRTPGPRYGDREIDLDLLIYGNGKWEAEGVLVPHPEMTKRSFVLLPLSELWPDWTHPDSGLSVTELLKRV